MSDDPDEIPCLNDAPPEVKAKFIELVRDGKIIFTDDVQLDLEDNDLTEEES